MSEPLKVAIIGLDTSHSVEFARRMQAPDFPENQMVSGIKAVTCLRFATPFQSEEGLDQRQAQLEEWGIQVTTDFEQAIQGVDAIMIQINDPSYHLEYFKKCAKLGLPIFLDKPLADNIENGKAIVDISKKENLRLFSSSSLRFATELVEAADKVTEPLMVSVYGPLGVAPAGSSIVWYGVHTFEMLQRAIGSGAKSVYARNDSAGAVCIVEYGDSRRGVVELNVGCYQYGGSVRNNEAAAPFVVDMGPVYTLQLKEVAKFFAGGKPAVGIDETLEIMGMLDAAERSSKSGVAESVF